MVLSQRLAHRLFDNEDPSEEVITIETLEQRPYTRYRRIQPGYPTVRIIDADFDLSSMSETSVAGFTD